MNAKSRFFPLVLTAVAAWAALAGILVVSTEGTTPATGHAIATTFPIAEAGFALSKDRS